MELINGVFIRELKNRFRCEVEVNNNINVCYVPASCRLSTFADFKGCNVILKKAKGNTTLEYSLFGIEYDDNFILIDLKETNKIVSDSLLTEQFDYLGERNSFKKEMPFVDYRSDFYIEDIRTIIEVKSVITLNECSPVKIVYSDRNIRQLKRISNLLHEGYSVYYIFVAMCNMTKEITISNHESEFYTLFTQNINNGMKVKAYSILWTGEDCKLSEEIKLNIR